MRAHAHRIATSSPSDVSGLAELFHRGVLRPEDVVAVLGKTEGNGGRNDFTRELATTAVSRVFADRLEISPDEVGRRVVLSFSGGTEGVASPHMVVLAVTAEAASGLREAGAKRLAIGTGTTRPFRPEEIGRRAQIDETARAVREIAGALRLESLRDVHLVQMKGALPSASFDEAEAARTGGAPLRNDMAHSRGASALAAGIAVGEIDPSDVSDDAVCRRWDLHSSVASVSAKPGLERTEIMVLANSPHWGGDLAIEHGVMRDILDVDTVRDTLGRLGVAFPGRPSPDQVARIVGVFAKAEADPRGVIRGRRHVMLDDDDVSDTRYARCTLAAVLASAIGDTAVYVSTRAEHHGPLGGGPVAIVARRLG